MPLGPVQRSLWHEEVVPFQVAFLCNVFAVVEAAGLLIAGIGAEGEFQPLSFAIRMNLSCGVWARSFISTARPLFFRAAMIFCILSSVHSV